MANVLVKESSLENIADAIRSKNGQTTKYKPAQMADAITAISGGGGITPTGTKTINITQNGTTTEDVTNYANAQVNVNVPNPSTGTKQITSNGTHDVTQYASAEVNVPNPSTGTQTFTANGTYDVTNIAEAVVNVESSGGETFTLLSQVTTTEDVTVISASYTEAMSAYDFFLLEIEGTYSGSMYICPNLNGGTSKKYNGQESGGNIHRRIFVVPVFNGSNNRQGFAMTIAKTDITGADNTITSFDMVSYYNTAKFKAGTTLKVYGATL